MVRKPVREFVEEQTEKVPQGPFSKVGDGNVVGAGGYVAASVVKETLGLIPGAKAPFYDITSHSTRDMEEFDRHEMTVAAIDKRVAEFAAKYAAAPSNIDYISSEIEIRDEEIIREKRAYTIYRFTVDVARSRAEGY